MAEHSLKLVVGLGNPGVRYAYTRHNAGFWLVDALAQRYGAEFRLESKFAGEICRIGIAEHPLWLFKPINFMNRSGESIRRIVDFYQIPAPAILIAHDELDLPPGTVRLKRGGGHGGHNGLRDTIKHLATNQFLRVRLGIGHPGHSDAVTGYVLSRAPLDEFQLIVDAVDDVIGEFPRIAAGQLDKAMHRLHSRRIEGASDEGKDATSA